MAIITRKQLLLSLLPSSLCQHLGANISSFTVCILYHKRATYTISTPVGVRVFAACMHA